MPTMDVISVGCAGWSIPHEHAEHFPAIGTHLERYGQRLTAVEINSSFYRAHRPETYARWAASVPEWFRFAVKVPKEITHIRRLCDAAGPLDRFLSEIRPLGDKLGPLLVQLPPSLRFQADLVEAYFTTLRNSFSGYVVCEPRHASWFTDEAEHMLVAAQVGRVAADPAPAPQARQPGGWSGLVYFRLHGSPEMYTSAYSDAELEALTQRLREAAQSAPTWCIFDNTSLGAATANALDLCTRLSSTDRSSVHPAPT